MVAWKKKFLKYDSYKTIDKFAIFFATLKGVSWKDTFHIFHINDTC